uniref:Major facilitator superfamily (MFS) profile domain-containing protein n=1 Tax=Leptobrachium leishanense TaxID=445787 RepID=A0A8C5R847_9ANUR
MGFAELLDRVGGLGRFQIIQLIMLCIPIFLMAGHNLLQNFSAAIPDHKCKVNESATLNTSLKDGDGWQTLFSLTDGNGKLDGCFERIQIQQKLVTSNTSWQNATYIDTIPCRNGWEYDRKEFSSTIITEWDLVCSNKHKRQLAQSIYMAGVLAGAIILGGLSDKYGRRAMLIWSYLQMAISGTCTAFSPNYLSYCVFRFLVGMSLSGISLNTTALIVEWVPTKVRTIVGTIAGYCYTAGQLLLAGLAYGIRDWRWLQLAISIPFIIFFFYSWWFPESARWLVLSGNPEKAVKVIKNVAVFNGKKEEAEKITLESLKSDMVKEVACGKETYSIVDLVRTSTLRRISCFVSFVWFSTSFSYYGLAMDLQKFGISIYLVQVIFGSVDIPAKLVSTACMIYIGRRVTQCASLILGGLAVLANIFVPTDLQILRTSLAVFGKGCFASSFSCVFLYTTEMYPTVVRQSGLGLGSTMARMGGIVAPLVKMLGGFYPFLPLAIYGAAPIISGLLVYFLPETVNKPLPDTIEDVELGSKTQAKQKKELVPLESQTNTVPQELKDGHEK